MNEFSVKLMEWVECNKNGSTSGFSIKYTGFEQRDTIGLIGN